MKRFFIITTIVLNAAFIFAGGSEESATGIRLAVMQGPTGFSSVFLDESITVEVYPSPNEAVSKIINGELDMAVLPVNTAVTLFNKGVPLKAVAIVGEGMLSIIGKCEDDVLYVPGIGGTPDQMALFLYPQYKVDYSITSPAQLAQLVIAGKVNMAILPEPFVSMVLSKNNSVSILSSIETEWTKKTGLKQYPMSILVTREAFMDEHPLLVKKVGDSFKTSIEKVMANPEEASVKIEELGIMKASLAKPAIPNCALIYSNGKDAADMADGYLRALNLESTREDFWIK